MISINDFLDYILAEFKGYLRSDPQLCHLKDVHYDAGKVPDYSDLHVQQLYLLRYAYAYAFEYKCMYKHLPRYMFDQPSLSIMSIGCGNMIDYWAIAQLVDPQVTLQYRGFDSVNWFNKFVAREQDQVLFTLGDAITAIEDMAVIPADVIVFPKSISEFDHEAIDRICQCVREKMILKDKVCVLVSLRADQGSVQRDMEKTCKIYNAFCDAGFSTESRSDTIIHFADHSKKIRELDTYYFQFTLNSYGTDVETNVPSKNNVVIPAFQKLSSQIGKERVVWRYDPILFTEKYTMDYHTKYFQILADKLSGYTEKCTVSFLDFYKNTQRNIAPLGIMPPSPSQVDEIMGIFSAIAKEHGIYIDTCAEEVDLNKFGISHARCIQNRKQCTTICQDEGSR